MNLVLKQKIKNNLSFSQYYLNFDGVPIVQEIIFPSEEFHDSFDESAALLLEFVRCDERPDPNEIRNKRPKNDLNSNKLLYSDNPLSGNSLLNGMAPKINHVKNGSLKGKFGDAHETDEMRIAGRIKQILFGKNTTGYDNYISAVPK